MPVLPASFAGCGAVLSGAVCELPGDGAVRVFVPGTMPARFFVDERTVDTTVVRTGQDGRLHRLTIPAGSRALTVEGVRDGAPARFVLKLAPPTPYRWLAEARALRQKGDAAGARARAEPATKSSDPTERALAIGLLARLSLQKGDVDDAVAQLRQSIALHSTRTSDRAEDAFALAFALNQRSRRYGEARAVLDEIEPTLSEYPEGRARLPFYRAEIALESGDVRSAIRGLREAEAAAARLGIVRLERNARGLLSTVLQIQGHFDEGIAALRALDDELGRDPAADGCDRADALANLGLSLERRARARADLGEPSAGDDLSEPAARALALFPKGCADSHRRGLALYIAAAAALERGALADARQIVSHGRAAQPNLRTNDVLQWLDLEARIAFADHRFDEARASYEEAIGIAEAAHQSDMLWRAVLGRAESLEALGRADDALDAYARAESLLDDQTLALPFGDGRGVYLSRSERSARLAIDLLLRRRRPAEAFAVARRARARLLVATARATSLDALAPAARARWDGAIAAFRRARAEVDRAAEEDWKLAAAALHDARSSRTAKITAMRAALDDAMSALGTMPRADAPLAAPAEGELWLGFHRARSGFVAFAATTERTFSFALADLEPTRVLAGVDAELSRSKRLIVLPYGPLRAVDVHAWPRGDGPLIAGVAVEYALDVPRVRAPATDDSFALVVDPTDDLPAAREEARALRALFGGAVRAAEGREATARTVEALLESAGTFHYAGHGVFGGPEGAESRLPLAAGSELGLLEILARPRVPRRVMLSACETGRASLDARTETIGLAQAFVIAGSESVIAPTRKVPDALAAKLAIAYYRALLDGAPPGEALARAQLRVRADDPAADWAAWRLLRP